MGKKRIAIIDSEPKEKAKKPKEEKEKIHIPGMKGGQRVAVVETEPVPEEKPATTESTEAEKKKSRSKTKQPRAHARGKKYLAARMKVDPTKSYTISEAIKLAKETSFGRFNGSIETHFVVIKTGLKGETSLPYFQTKTKRVAIATPETIKKIESGKIDFDILISTPAFMPNLVKFAKVLGPKGLMPNPKNGTIADDPEKAVQKLQKESFSFRTEDNAPLIHAVIGKTSQKEEEIAANLNALIQAIGPKNIKKAVIAGSMGPGIKVDLS